MLTGRELITLDDKKLQFVRNGWGDEVADVTDVWKIKYRSGDTEVNGYFALPKNVNEKLPLIIWNRGGSKKAGAIDTFLARGIFGEIASWGYSVLASQYREDEEFGGKDVYDVLNLFELADELSYCDTSRIGMEGWSRGGMMTYLVLTKTNKVKCAVIISGLADVVRNEKEVADMSDVYRQLLESDDEDEFVQKMKQRSAVHFYEKINKDTPVLLIHGTDDKRVSFSDSEEMYDNLKRNGNTVEMISIENGDHYLKKNRKEVSELRKKWFAKYLKN